jgi:glycine hydroxymethyltransferase
MHVIAAKAVALKEAMGESFKNYQRQVVKNTAVLAAVIMERGYKLVSGGTDNHMVLVDLSGKDISGKDAEERLGKAGITVNKNSVPNEKRSPFITSGIRIGMPLVTSRGMMEDAAREIGTFICDVLDDASGIDMVKNKVRQFCANYPLYSEKQA